MTRHLALARIINPFSILGKEKPEEKCLYLFIRIDRMVMTEVREGAHSKVVNQVVYRSAPIHSKPERADAYEIFFRKRLENRTSGLKRQKRIIFMQV